MCFSFPLTIDWVPRQFLSLWASPSPFAPAASAWPRTRREGRGGGAVAVAGSRLPAYVRNESRAASPPGRDGAAQRDPAKSGSAPFRRGVSLSGCSGWRCLPLASPARLVSGGGHSGDATVTKMRSVSGSRSAHVRGPAGAPRVRAPGLGSGKDPGGSN